MKKTIRVILSPEAKEVYKYLNQQSPNSKHERTILKAVNNKIELIKINIHFGNPIAKGKIPPDYKTKYNITNLFRVELPHYWRMLYTLTEGGTEIEIVAFVLDIFDHKDYNKKFRYREN